MISTPTPGCLTPLSANSTSLSPTHLAVGQLPSIQQFPQIRDPEWLKVEVCREFQRGACKRTAEECRYAHPGKHIQVSAEGKVIACYDALKGKCNRETCKYLHPTYQLKQQLEITGRQTLIQNRAMLQQMLPLHQVHTASALPQAGLFGYEQLTGANSQQLASSLTTNQLYTPAAVPQPSSPTAYSVLPATDLGAINPHIMPYYQLTAAPTQVAAMLPAIGGMRADKLEVCRDYLRGNCSRGEYECRYGHPADRSMIDPTDNTVTVCMDCIKGRCAREKCKYFHPPAHLQAKIRAAQNPASAYVPSLSPVTAAVGSTQPAMMVANGGTALGQPPLKRHAVEPAMIATSCGTGGNSPGLTSSSSSPPNALAALNGYSSATLPILTSLQHQSLPAAPTYYQQALPILQLQYGGTTGALAAPPAPTSSLTHFSLPNTTSTAVNGGPAPYAFLNGQNQRAGDLSLKSSPIAANASNTLTVCRDFQSGKCTRTFCRFVHVREGKCDRPQCKYYHFPNISVLQNQPYLEPVCEDASAVEINGVSPNFSPLMGLVANRALPIAQ